MQPGGTRYPLSVGFERQRAVRITLAVICGVFGTVACGVLGGLLGWIATSFGEAAAGTAADGTADSPKALVIVLALLLGGVFATGTGLLVAFQSRAAAWLEGTRLTVRNLTTRTVDIAAATSITLTAINEGGAAVATPGGMVVTGAPVRTPMLLVSTPTGSVRLRLRDREGALLPPHQMVTLAGVLSTARCPGAAQAAHWLRGMAADPRSLLM